MIIRTAIVADAPQIAALWNPLIDATSITFPSEKKTIDGLEAVIRARGDAFKVIEEGGTLQGFATFFQFCHHFQIRSPFSNSVTIFRFRHHFPIFVMIF